jgi:hypothetical protein
MIDTLKRSANENAEELGALSGEKEPSIDAVVDALEDNHDEDHKNNSPSGRGSTHRVSDGDEKVDAPEGYSESPFGSQVSSYGGEGDIADEATTPGANTGEDQPSGPPLGSQVSSNGGEGGDIADVATTPDANTGEDWSPSTHETNPYTAVIAQKFSEENVLPELREFSLHGRIKDGNLFTLVDTNHVPKHLRWFAHGFMVSGYEDVDAYFDTFGGPTRTLNPETVIRSLFVAPAPPDDARCRYCKSWFHSFQTFSPHDIAYRNSGICQEGPAESAMHPIVPTCFFISPTKTGNSLIRAAS